MPHVVAVRRVPCGCRSALRSDGKKLLTVCAVHCLPAPFDKVWGAKMRTEEYVLNRRRRAPPGWEDSVLFQ